MLTYVLSYYDWKDVIPHILGVYRSYEYALQGMLSAFDENEVTEELTHMDGTTTYIYTNMYTYIIECHRMEMEEE